MTGLQMDLYAFWKHFWMCRRIGYGWRKSLRAAWRIFED